MTKKKSEAVLVVDDDQRLLDGLVRIHRRSFHLETACGSKEGLRAVAESGPYAVVVSDYQMPEMDGITFLSKVQEVAPDTVRIMLTGNADLSSAIEAVNRGRIFRFLTKPCEEEVFRSSLAAGIDQNRLVRAEKILLEQTLQGCVAVLAEVLGLANPMAFGRANRVQSYVRHMVEGLQLDGSWRYETAALLSQIGCVAIPGELLAKAALGEELSQEQSAMLDRHPMVAGDLLGKIPRLEVVADMIAHQSRSARRTGLSEEVDLGSRILALALDFDARISGGASRRNALADLAKHAPAYDDKLLAALADVQLPGTSFSLKSLPIAKLGMGMILDEDVKNAAGSLIVAKGHEITRGLLERLRNYAELGQVAGSIRVLVPQGAERTVSTS